MKNIFYYMLFTLCTPVILSSCEDDNDSSMDMTTEVDILDFSINGIDAKINPENSSISLILPTGTDLKNLSPQIKISEGAVISPKSGEAVDFVDNNGNLQAVTYTVAYKDSYQQYTVSADIARARITKFMIGAVVGDINETAKKIVLYLPVETNLTSLFPNVEYTAGAALTPATGESVDFTNPVTFRLNYSNSVFSYEVTVIAGEKPIPNFIIYNGEDISPTWGGIAVSSINSKIANPRKNDVNSSEYCASILRVKEDSDSGGKPWSGGALWNAYKVDIDPAKYSRLSVKVLKQTAGAVQLEVQADGEKDKDWLKVSYSADKLGEWQELIFDIPEGRTAHINNILIAPHCEDPNTFETQQIYWDDLKAIPK